MYVNLSSPLLSPSLSLSLPPSLPSSLPLSTPPLSLPPSLPTNSFRCHQFSLRALLSHHVTRDPQQVNQTLHELLIPFTMCSPE